MSFDPHPATWLGAGASNGTHTLILNTNDAVSNKTLPQLTDVQANVSTGDIRAVAYALCEALYQASVTQGASGQSNRMQISRSVSGAGSTSPAHQTVSFSMMFELTPTAVAVSTE